jgi:DHA1 family tetracycline resistance protein-like MFS transporter
MTVVESIGHETSYPKPNMSREATEEALALIPGRAELGTVREPNGLPEAVRPVSAASKTPMQLFQETLVPIAARDRLENAEQQRAAWYDRVSRRTVMLLYALVASDACTLMVIGPFLPAFVEQRLSVPPQKNASVVGVISGAYNFGNSLLAPQLGNLSDRQGRRPYLLFSVIVSATLTACFPFTRQAWTAIAVRFATGMLNASSTVSKAFLADLTCIERGALASDRALLFGYFGAVWAIARSLGSAASGALTGVSLPWLGIEATKNPFVTPCVAMSVFLWIVFLVALLALPESLSPVQRQERRTTEAIGFLSRVQTVFHAGGPVLRRVLVCNAIHQFCNGGLLIILVLFASESRMRGGMGFGPNAVGVSFSYFGFVGVLFQLTIFRRVLERLGSRRMYLLGTSLLAVGTLLVPAALPLSNRLRRSWHALFATTDDEQSLSTLACDWFPVLLLLFPIGCGFMAGLPILNTLVANAAPLQVQGLAQGLCQSSGGILRTLGPILTGAGFGYLADHAHLWFSFLGLSVLYVLCGMIVATLPPTIERSYEELEQMRAQELARQATVPATKDALDAETKACITLVEK